MKNQTFSIAQIESLPPGESLALARRIPIGKANTFALVRKARDDMKNRLASPVNMAKIRGHNLRLETHSSLTHDGSAIIAVAVITHVKV